MASQEQRDIRAIVGLGNPGNKFELTRHNIGFRVVDALADRWGASWSTKENMEFAQARFNDKTILLIKPQTFMNDSGKIMSFLSKQGIKAENMLVVHDELEKPFGKLVARAGGSARGHNGLRSLMGTCGPDFIRLRFGIGRPERKEDVGNYVLMNFTRDEEREIEELIQKSIDLVEQVTV